MDLKNRFNQTAYNTLKNRIQYFNSTYMSFRIEDIENVVKDIILFGGLAIFGKVKHAEYRDDNRSSSFMFSRIRKVNGCDYNTFNDVNQFFALPSNRITWEGRLNTQGESLLYASHNSFVVPIFEISVKIGDNILLIIYKRKPNTVITLQKMAIDNEQIINLDNYAAKVNDLKLDFVRLWLTKHGNGINDAYIYRITNSIKKIYTVKRITSSFDGFIYPSTTKKSKDFNVALNETGIEKLYIENVFLGQVVNIENNSFSLKSKYCFLKVEGDKVVWRQNEEYMTRVFLVNEKT